MLRCLYTSLVIAMYATPCFVVAQGTNTKMTISLNEGWTFRALGARDVYHATVPGSVHHDLWLNGIIDDPFVGTNFDSLDWIDTTTWVYELTIPLNPELRLYDEVRLIFEGLDTYADIYIDDNLILQTNNMHRIWRFLLKENQLNQDSLHIMAVFHPAILTGATKSRSYSWVFPADNDPYPGKPSVFSRKAHYQFGWDFSPAMPGAGIWKAVRLEALPCTSISDMYWESIELTPDTAYLLLHLTVHANSPKNALWAVRLGTVADSGNVQLLAGKNLMVIPFKLPNPRLWWPRGYGEPYLYDSWIALNSKCGSETFPSKVGIRKVLLNQSPDHWGTAFEFIINDTSVMCKGANWVPADVFPGRVSDDKYRNLLRIAADAGMNMLRVWGGGIYEKDLFYQLADSLGIMIWQDFMFAGTMYPGDEDFLENIRLEVEEQITRLRNHPSIVLWCGNNEVDVAWKNWGWQTTYNYSDSIVSYLNYNYDLIFHKFIPKTLEKLTSGTPYIHTSPLRNWGRKIDLDHGNNHYWGVWHGDHAIDSFSTWISRFMTEYGLPSYSNLETLYRYIPDSMRTPDHKAVAGRQRSYKGIAQMRYYMASEGLAIDLKDFDGFVKASHHIQTLGLQKAIRAHLNDSPRCSGSLLWQFNETWPGASWSIVDYNGLPKRAWFAVAALFNKKIADK